MENKKLLNSKEVLEGKWGWDENQCLSDPILISFSSDGLTMYHDTKEGLIISDEEKRYQRLEYSILSESKGGLETLLKGEGRKDSSGNIVSWYLSIKSEDTFCWRRSDWPENACTKPLIKCK